METTWLALEKVAVVLEVGAVAVGAVKLYKFSEYDDIVIHQCTSVFVLGVISN